MKSTLLFLSTALALYAVPTISPIPDQQALVGKEWHYSPAISDDNGSQISLSISSTVSFAMDNTGRLSWTPTADDIGDIEVVLKASSDGVDVADTFTITVKESNAKPVLSSVQDQITKEDTPFTVTSGMITASDVNNDPLFIIVNPNGELVDMLFDFSWNGNTITPNENFNGELMIPIAVSDGIDTSEILSMKLTVTPVNDAPKQVAQLPAIEVESDKGFSIPLESLFSDPDGDDITLTAVEKGTESLPEWLVLEGTALKSSPTDPGTVTIEVTADDGQLSSSMEFSITITQASSVNNNVAGGDKSFVITHGNETLNIAAERVQSLTVVDLHGRVIHQQKIESSAVDLSPVITAQGIFIVNLKTPQGIVVQKIVK